MISRRMEHINPFYVMKILARARQLEKQGREIIHLEIGEPDFTTPQPIVQAGVQALNQGKTHYSPAKGILELRQTISQYYETRFKCAVDAERIVITPGASGALLLALGAVLDVDDEVLIADPAYPCYRHFAHFLSAKPISIPVGADEQFQLSLDLVKQNWSDKTKAVIIASPSNPTGTMIEKDQLKAIHEFVEQREGVLVVDEIYQELVYDREAETALGQSDNIIVINSFSKYFGMTGWRLGWLVVNESLLPMIDKLMQNLFLAAPTPAQYAAIEAFSAEALNIMEQRRQIFSKRRDFLLKELDRLGFGIPVEPHGAFYIYASCQAFSSNSEAFAHDLLEQIGVAVTPGRDFGAVKSLEHLRFAYTTDESNLRQAISLIETYLQQ